MIRVIMGLVLVGLLILSGCARFQSALEVAKDPRDPMLIYPSYQSGVLLERFPGEVMDQRGPHEVIIVPRKRATDSFGGGYGYTAPPQQYYTPPVTVAPDRGGGYRSDSYGHKRVVCIKKWWDGRRERIEKIRMTIHEWTEWSRIRREREQWFGKERNAPEWKCVDERSS